MITNIQRFSLDDGPGIRTTVFAKGCPLACRWCHNPECIDLRPQLQFTRSTCSGCGICMQVCPSGVHILTDGQHTLDFTRCTSCGACIKACPSVSLALTGQAYSPEALVDEVLKDRPFFENSGGGITISGGEPLLQADFFRCVMHMLKEEHNVHIALDTCGSVAWQAFEKLLPWTDLVLYDIKCLDSVRHRALTGSGNELILENLRRLDEAGVPVWIRMPLIEALNDDAGMIEATAKLLSGYACIRRIDILPFHRYGEAKYASIGREYTGSEFKRPDQDHLEEIAGCFRKYGFEQVYIGS